MSAIRSDRGMVMILVIVLVALLLIVALTLITGANTAVLSTTAVSIKYRVENAAEGAANVALNDVATNPAEEDGKVLSGALNNVAYSAFIVANNMLGHGTKKASDPANGDPIYVPAGSAYLYGTASDDGGHTTYVESIAVPAPALTMPDGTVNSGHDIQDLAPMMVSSDPTDSHSSDDAVLNADGNITVTGTPSVVQGYTYAAGSDQLPSVDGSENTLTGSLNFPNAVQVAEAARTAQLSAQAGAQYSGTQISNGGTQTYSGNVYINGNVVLDSGTATFSGGNFVYVNGNLCIGGTGNVVNQDAAQGEFFVSGNVEVTGAGTYSTTQKSNVMLVALGADNSSSSCSSTNLHAIDLAVSTPVSVSTLFTPNGSIAVSGPGALAGALDAVGDVLLDGTDTKMGMQYDIAQQQTTIDTGTLTFGSYFEH